jgi:agmatine deiminase
MIKAHDNLKTKFYMPAEWHKKQRTFIEFPVREDVWPDINQARISYANIANIISEFEPVTIISKADIAHIARDLCNPNVEILALPHDDSWVRDNGPTFVINKNHEIAGVSWNFNAWGEKYTPYNQDNTLANRLLDHLGIKAIHANVTLEGGAIHVDGQGTLITTKECILNPNRNKNITQAEFEDIFNKYLGVKKVIWLESGLYGDETDGHVDNVACFVAPEHVVIQGTSDKDDPNYNRFMENLAILKNATDVNNKKLTITVIEQPPARFFNGERLTLSYINYYLVNGGVIVPVFGAEASESDDKAINILKDLFPNRKVVAADGSEIIKGGGNIHCITQQMPSV